MKTLLKFVMDYADEFDCETFTIMETKEAEEWIAEVTKRLEQHLGQGLDLEV